MSSKTSANSHLEDVEDPNRGGILADLGDHAGEKGGNPEHMKLAPDGHTVLIPQPSDDPSDPLNWSDMKKNTILFIVALGAFCGDFGSGAGIPCIVLQGQEWGLSPSTVNSSGNLNVLFLGIGGVFWIPVIYFWGRAPVLFWTTLTGLFFTLGCALTGSFEAYYGLRVLMGFTLTACQTIGLAFIKDMFYFHEHARKIGIWAAIFLVAPYLGPCLGNFIIDGTGDWRPIFWLVFGLCFACFTLICLFADETWYNRAIPMDRQPPRPAGHLARLSRVVGIWQLQNHSGYFLPVGSACMRLGQVFLKPLIPCIMIYYALSFMWGVGINITTSILLETPISLGGYGFGAKAIGYIYFTPLVGVAIGETFGHYFNDFVANRYMAKHNGVFQPECRLYTNYIAAILMIPGLVIVGQGLHHHLHWASIVMGWGMYVVGMLVASVAISTYALDSYPKAAGEVGGFLNLARVVAGFSVGYFQMPWGLKTGYDVSFGIQAAIVAFAVILLFLIQKNGRYLRERFGPVEFDF